MKVAIRMMAILLVTLLVCGQQLQAGVIWDGDGAAASDWGTAANWDSDTLPAFDGTDDINMSSINGSGTGISLGADRNINSLLSSDSTPNWTLLAGNTLTLQSGEIRKSNQAGVTINANIALAADGRFRTDNASNSGIVINGVVSDSGGVRNVVVESVTGNLTLSGLNTYTGNTVVRRGTLSADSVNVSSGSASPFGNSTGAVLVGDTQTGTNNWPVTLSLRQLQMARDITFVNTGSSGIATLNLNGSLTDVTGTVTLDRDINLSYGQPGSLGKISGLITGVGGFTKTGGVEAFRLTNTANDFSGDIKVTKGQLRFDISGGTNALGLGTTAIDFSSGTSSRGIQASGSGTFSRDIDVTGGTGQVTIGTASGNTQYSGAIDLGSTANIFLSAGNSVTANFTGLISGSAPVITLGSVSSNTGNTIILANPNSSFSSELRIGQSHLFIGADAPSGSNGALGNSTAAVKLAYVSSGVNPSRLYTNGAFTVGRDIEVVDLGSYNGQVLIGGSTADVSSYTGNILINDRGGSQSDVSFSAATGGTVTFSGVISGDGGVRRDDQSAPFSTLGDVIFGGNNTYTGNTRVLAGRLILEANNTLGGIGTGTTVSSGATLGFQGSFDYSSVEAVSIIGSGLSGQGAINNISGDNTFAGAITTTGSSTLGATGGSLRLSGGISGGNALAVTGLGTVYLDGTVTASSVSVGSGATLGGTGTISGSLSGAGTVDPGNSPGILTAAQVVPTSGLDFDFEVTQINPDYNSPSASGNDVLRLTGGTPFSSALGGTNDVNIYFNFGFMAGKNGDYQVGFYTDNNAAFDSSLTLANINFLVRENGGPISYDGQQYEDFAVAFPSALATWTTINPASTQFGGQDGFVFQVTLSGLPEVPEPSSVTLLGLGIFGLITHARRRRRRN